MNDTYLLIGFIATQTLHAVSKQQGGLINRRQDDQIAHLRLTYLMLAFELRDALI